MRPTPPVPDDPRNDAPARSVGTRWQLVTDRVMGGVSEGTLSRETVLGRRAMRMRGDVSLDNNGGFVQMAMDLAPGGQTVDASGWQGFELDVLGKEETYEMRLRTPDLARPWQSYRHGFTAGASWTTVRLRFADFEPHRTGTPLDLRRLRRLGLIAIGRAFSADLSVAGLRLFA